MSCLLWPSLCIDKTRGSEKSYQGCIADGACTCYDYCLPSKHQWCQCINYKVHHYITALLALLSTSFMIHKCRLMMWCALRLECSSAIIWQLDDMIAVKKLSARCIFQWFVQQKSTFTFAVENFLIKVLQTHTLELTSLYAGQQLLNCISLNCQQ